MKIAVINSDILIDFSNIDLMIQSYNIDVADKHSYIMQNKNILKSLMREKMVSTNLVQKKNLKLLDVFNALRVNIQIVYLRKHSLIDPIIHKFDNGNISFLFCPKNNFKSDFYVDDNIFNIKDYFKNNPFGCVICPVKSSFIEQFIDKNAAVNPRIIFVEEESLNSNKDLEEQILIDVISRTKEGDDWLVLEDH